MIYAQNLTAFKLNFQKAGWTMLNFRKSIRKIIVPLTSAVIISASLAGCSSPSQVTTSETGQHEKENTDGGNAAPEKEIIGYSNEDFEFFEGNSKPEISDMKNDPAEKKKILLTYTENEFLPFALNYKKEYMKPGETHFIVNFSKSTTTKIADNGEFLDISITKYSEGEEENAEVIGQGDLLGEYYIFSSDKSIIRVK